MRVLHRRRRARRLEDDTEPIERVDGEKARGLQTVGEIAVRIAQQEHGHRSAQRRRPIAQVRTRVI